MARVLIAEEIASVGITHLESAGHTVDVILGMSPEQLLDEVATADALIIRSATKVTKEVLEASQLTVVGRAGVGLDNVDVAAATDKGVMVVNAPQSNVLSAAEHTMALMLAQARNVPQAMAALKEHRWERSRWTGVELSDKTLGIVGFGRIGRLVAVRAMAFGMKVIAYDPFVTPENAAAMGVELLPIEDVVARSDFLTLHLAKTPETLNMINAELLAKAKPELRVINVARGGIINEADLAAAVKAGTIAGAAIDVFETEPTTESPLFELDSVVVTPHLGASTHEAQDKAGTTIAEQVALALSGDFVPFAVNVAATPAADEVRPFLPLCETLGSLFARMIGAIPASVDIEFIGAIGAYDNQLASMAVTKGMLAVASGAPVSYVNAGEMARSMGVTFRTINTDRPEDHVNVVAVRGGGHELSGTITAQRGAQRLVSIDGHSLDLPITDNTVIIKNENKPGVIGHVTSTIGGAGINIDDMAVGQSATGPSLMAIITNAPIPPAVLAQIVAHDGVTSAQVV